jgi:hypothetical protein
VVIPPSVNWISATVSSAAGATGPSLTTPGIGNGTVEINVLPYVTNASREAEITIAGIKHTIKQNPGITSVSPRNKSVSAAATSYPVTVGTAGTWSVVIPSSVNWISATVSSVGGATGSSFTTPGSGNGTVVITLALNVTNTRREAEIMIAGIKHTIIQEFR